MALSREEFAKLLIELRETHDPPLDQAGAAKLIGMSLRRYAPYERGKAEPRLTTITKIADAYGIEPQRLVTHSRAADQPTRRELARLEVKINLILDHLNIVAQDADLERMLPPEFQLPADEPAPAPKRRPRRST